VPEATCPAARQFTPDALTLARERHPGAALVVDLRSPAECKVLADITCTPESAARIIGSLSEEQVILALPDPDPSEWVMGRVPGKEILPLSPAVVDASGERSVPPCPGGVRRGSHRGGGVIGAAEARRTVVQEAGNGRAFLARNCTICHGMRQTTLPDLYRSLRTGSPRVEIPGAVLLAARQPVLRMVGVLGRTS
jgi:quinolinate synthase